VKEPLGSQLIAKLLSTPAMPCICVFHHTSKVAFKLFLFIGLRVPEPFWIILWLIIVEVVLVVIFTP
jgi:hypothetical protein